MVVEWFIFIFSFVKISFLFEFTISKHFISFFIFDFFYFKFLYPVPLFFHLFYSSVLCRYVCIFHSVLQLFFHFC